MSADDELARRLAAATGVDPAADEVTAAARRLVELRDDLVGRRVRLVRCSDEYTRIEPGTEGVVTLIDSVGTVFVDWDDGSRLGMIAGVDEWVLITR